MAVFYINIEKNDENDRASNLVSFLQNCYGIHKDFKFKLRGYDDEYIRLLDSYPSEFGKVLSISFQDINTNDIDNFKLIYDGDSKYNDFTVDLVDPIDIDEEIPNLELYTNIPSGQFSLKTISFKITLETEDEGSVYAGEWTFELNSLICEDPLGNCEECPPGKDGQSPELKKRGGHIDYKYPDESDANWRHIIKIEDLVGEDGKSAFDLWLELNPGGTMEDFMDFIAGDDGEDGKSSLELWLELNPGSNEKDYWEYFKGDEGEDGLDGETCRKYRVYTEDEVVVEYTPCDNCEGQTTVETILAPIRCGYEKIYSSEDEKYPSIQNVNIGEETGTVVIDYDASTVPDRFILKQGGTVIVDTGYVGSPDNYGYNGTYRNRIVEFLEGRKDPITGDTYPLDASLPNIEPDGYPKVIGDDNQSRPGKGSISFEKNTSEQNYEMSVYAPIDGTGWRYLVNCPKGGVGNTGGYVEILSLTEPIIVDGDGTIECAGIASGKKGDRGFQGKSAFEIWKDKEGSPNSTFEEYLEAIKGEEGKSAYQIWLDNGHSGTEEDFLEWLRENSGDKYYEEFITDPLKAASITHNLEKYPAVHAQDEEGNRFEIQVTYLNKNEIRVHADVTLENSYIICN